MSDAPQPSDALKSGINGALIVALVVMGASFYVRFTSDPDPAWTAFPMPVALILLGLRSLLLTPDAYHSARTQRIVGGLLVVLSAILLILNIVELNMDRAR
jgi:hypothetical protein